MDKLKKIKKYSKFFLKMISHSVKLIQCNKEKCKKEFNKQEKYKDVINEKISKLSKKEESTELFKTFYKKREIIRESYNTNKDVKQYLENLKKNIENDVKITLSYKREFKKFIRNNAGTIYF